MNSRVPDKKLAAVCGLFCPACTFFIGSLEDRPRLEKLSRNFGLPVEKLECHGCRSEKRAIYCEKFCKFRACAAKKGIDFCGACSDFPCAELKTFQAQMPHRIELWQSQERIKEVGWEQWYKEMYEHFSCPECHTVNSTYDIACRKCGHTPSCKYVELHKNEIAQHSAKLAL